MRTSALNRKVGLIPAMALKDRIREAMEGAKLSPADLARATKSTNAAVTFWLSGQTKSLKAEKAAMIEVATGYNAQWIVSGKGLKKPTSPQHSDQQTAATDQPITSNVSDIASRRSTDTAENALRILADIIRPMSSAGRVTIANNLKSFGLDPDDSIAWRSLLAGLDEANARRRYEPPPQSTVSNGG